MGLDNDSVNTVSSSFFTVWIDEVHTEPQYSDGTKLLRDAAQRAEDYCWKKARSRSGWKTRYELRDV